MSSTFRVRLTPSSRKRVGPRDRAWQRQHGQAATIGERVGRLLVDDLHAAREVSPGPARDAIGHAYSRVVPNRIDAEPLDPQTPAYWRAVWELE